MSKPTDHDKTHSRNIAAICTRIDRIFRKAAEEAAKIGVSIKTALPEDRIFSFDDYPATRKQIERLMAALQESVETTIVNGVRSAWTLSNNKNNALVSRIFGDRVADLRKEQYRRYFSTNGSALEAFLARKEQGLNLSDRVWRYTEAFRQEIELALDLGIRSGESAAQMSRSLRQYLQYPDKLFRRVRDKHGLLRLSKAAAAFHPGRGVYRSSYKNARRLAATETNIAYRTSDHLRWQQMDFVVGIEIMLSNNHTVLLQPGERTDDKSQQRKDGSPKSNAVRPLTDICDTLAGRYPKDFKFTGWHPHCRCHAVTILKTDDELAEDTRRILAGQQPMKGSVNTVRDVPDAFKDWVEENADRIGKRGKLPYFIADNKARVNAIIGLNKTVTIGDREWTIRELIGECRTEKTDNGKVYVHPGHGKNELADNIEFAKWRANQFGEEVILLPNPQNVKSADSYNITRGVMEEYKRGRTASFNAIDRLIRDGAKQAGHIILEPPMMSAGDLADALNDRIARTRVSEVRIRIGKLEAVYTRQQIVSPGFKIRPEDFLNESAFRNRGSSLKGVEPDIVANADAKVAKFFGLGKETPLETAKKRHAARTAEQSAAIQKAWNDRRIANLQKAVKDGLLPKEAIKGLGNLAQDELNNRIAFLQKTAQRHAARTQQEINDIRMRWENSRKDMMQDNIEEDLARALGIRKGSPMTFEEANELRGNPHYAEDKQYRVNCQSCVVSNELRRRGLDVEAYGNIQKKGFNTYALSMKTEAAWVDDNGNIPVPTVIRREIKKTNATINKNGYVRVTKSLERDDELKKKMADAMSEVGRYHISWMWKKKKSGHIITAERLSDGTLRFYDPQSGKTGFGWSMSEIDAHRIGFKILRVDTLKPNVDVISGVVKRSGSTAGTPMMTEIQKAFWKATNVGKWATDGSKLTEFKKSIRQSEHFPVSKERNAANLHSGRLAYSGKNRKMFINHCRSEAELEAAEYIWSNPDMLEYVGSTALGYVKDMDNEKDRKNVAKKKKRGVQIYNEYKFKFNGNTWYVKLEETNMGNELFYSIIKK